MATTMEADASNTTTNNAENTTSRIIKIQSNDGQIFEIDQGVVEQSSTIKTLSDCKFDWISSTGFYFKNFYLVMDVGDVPIPLPNVKASILGPVGF